MALAALAVCIVASADAQTPLLTLDTPNPSYASTFGYSVAMGDVNADGKTDIAVGASNEEVGGNVEQGRAYVFSGANGSLLFTLTTGNPQPYAHFGPSVAMGDVNGDGKADIAVGATGENVGQGRAYIFSGANGSLLRTLNTPNPDAGGYFGWSVAVGDVNGDAKADIAVGAPYESVGDNAQQGRAYVFSSLPPPPVGGIAELPDVGSDSGWSAGAYAALAGGLAAALLALTAGAWYARRRWLR